MSGLFDFLNRYGKTKLVSNPKILTMNNQPAIINIGDELSYQYKDGYIILKDKDNGSMIKK